jgi:DNA modification methylase
VCNAALLHRPIIDGLRDYGTAKWEGGAQDCHHFRDEKGKYKNTGKVDLGSGDAIYKETCKKCGAVRIDKQIGIEQTPNEYVQKLVDVFKEVKRVLKNDGTLWVVIGDSYARSGGSQRDTQFNRPVPKERYSLPRNANAIYLKPKDLIGIPWMLAFALRDSGWYLRQDIIWSKPSCLPESVTDRCTKAHEYIFLLSKNKKYYFDQESIYEQANYDGRKDTFFKGSTKYNDPVFNKMQKSENERWKRKYDNTDYGSNCTNIRHHSGYSEMKNPFVRNKRSVWVVSPEPFKDAHFAVFPQLLIEPMIKAGCPLDGIVLDPFIGAGTTALVARKLNRNFIGFELNQNYINLAMTRLRNELGLFYE